MQRQPGPWPGILTDITRTWSWVADPQSPGARLRILAQGPLPTAGLGGLRREEEAGLGLAPRLRGGHGAGGHRLGGHHPLLGLAALGCAPLPRSFQGWEQGRLVKREELTPTFLRGFRGKGLSPRRRGRPGEPVAMLSARETLSLERGGPGASCVSLRPGWESPEGAGGWGA